MATYVFRKGKLVEKSKAGPVNGAPYVISDTMAPTQHMVDGKMYDSKKSFRAATKAAGCIEYGSETTTLLKPRKPVPLDRGQRRDAIRQVLYDARNR